MLERGATPYFGTPPKTSTSDGALSDSEGGDAVRTLVDQRVLVVEDEALVAMELARILTDAGAQVIGPAAW